MRAIIIIYLYISLKLWLILMAVLYSVFPFGNNSSGIPVNEKSVDIAVASAYAHIVIAVFVV